MFEIVKKLYQIFPRELSSKIKFLCFFLILGTFLEMMSIGVLLSLIITIFGENLTITKYLMSFLSDLLGISDLKKIKFIILGFVLFFFIFKNLILYLVLLYKNKFIFGVNKILSEKLFQNCLKSNYDFFFHNNLSTITRTIEVDALSVSKLTFFLLTILTEVITIIGLASLLLIVNFEVSIIILILGTILSSVYFFLIYKKIKKWGNLRQTYLSQRFKLIQETILGIKDIFIHQAENFFFKKFRNVNDSVIKILRKDNDLMNFPRYLFEIFIIILILTTIFILLLENNTNEKIILTLSILITSASRVYPAFTRLITSFHGVRFNKPALEKIFERLVLSNKFKKNEYNNINYKEKIESLKISNFNYSYKKDLPILKNIDLEFHRDKVYGITGESGAGKTTILNFICGLLTAENYKIFLNGRESTHEEFVKKIGYIPQHVFLFNDTIKRNIAIGIDDEEINSDKINNILKNLKLENFLINKELKVDKDAIYLGESGSKVSGGQRQRIGLARALYFDPEIIIFDETTSALDIENEKKIIDLILKNKKNKITIIVSHNKNMIDICNTIYEIKNKSIKIIKS